MSSAETVVDQARKFVGIVDTYVAKMPRDTKFTLGDRLLVRSIDVLEMVTDAYYSPREAKRPLLRRANTQIEVVRQILRLLHETGRHDLRKHEHFSRELDAIGRAVGAWSKSLAAPSAPAHT